MVNVLAKEVCILIGQKKKKIWKEVGNALLVAEKGYVGEAEKHMESSSKKKQLHFFPDNIGREAPQI